MSDKTKTLVYKESMLEKLSHFHPDYMFNITSIKNFIKEEPEVVRKGEWIAMSDADGAYWACSECGEDLPRVSHYNPQFDLSPRLESIDKTNYCPSCGADMRG